MPFALVRCHILPLAVAGRLFHAREPNGARAAAPVPFCASVPAPCFWLAFQGHAFNAMEGVGNDKSYPGQALFYRSCCWNSSCACHARTPSSQASSVAPPLACLPQAMSVSQIRVSQLVPAVADPGHKHGHCNVCLLPQILDANMSVDEGLDSRLSRRWTFRLPKWRTCCSTAMTSPIQVRLKWRRRRRGQHSQPSVQLPKHCVCLSLGGGGEGAAALPVPPPLARVMLAPCPATAGCAHAARLVRGQGASKTTVLSLAALSSNPSPLLCACIHPQAPPTPCLSRPRPAATSKSACSSSSCHPPFAQQCCPCAAGVPVLLAHALAQPWMLPEAGAAGEPSCRQALMALLDARTPVAMPEATPAPAVRMLVTLT